MDDLLLASIRENVEQMGLGAIPRPFLASWEAGHVGIMQPDKKLSLVQNPKIATSESFNHIYQELHAFVYMKTFGYMQASLACIARPML